MSRANKDALVEEIAAFCAYSAAAEPEHFSAESAPYRKLFSAYQLGTKTLPNRCLIMPKAMGGTCFPLADNVRRFYLERADAGLLTTGPLSTGESSDPHLLQRWIPLNERLHAKGAWVLLQLLLDGTAKRALTLASAGAAAGFDGVCFDARVPNDALAQLVRYSRAKFGSGFLILCRVSLSSAVAESGLGLKKNSKYHGFAEQLTWMTELAQAGVDAFEVNIGCEETPWLMTPSSQMPAGCFAEAARALKAHFRVLGIHAAVIAYGRLSDPGLAEALLKNDYCDLISLDGPGIEDPGWLQKTGKGLANDICPRMLPVYSMPEKHERIAVIGGGCRGLNYAMQAADAGHIVDLYEEKTRLGGDLALFRSRASETRSELLDYLIRELKKRPNIRLHAGTRANAELLKKYAYDRVVFACRAETFAVPSVPGWGEIHFISLERLDEAFSGQWKKKRVAVLGSDALACDLAWVLQNEGFVKHCVLLTNQPAVMSGEAKEDRAWFKHHFVLNGGQIMTGQQISRIRSHSVFTEDPISGTEKHASCDLIILAERQPAPLRLYGEAVREQLAPQIQLL